MIARDLDQRSTECQSEVHHGGAGTATDGNQQSLLERSVWRGGGGLKAMFAAACNGTDNHSD